MKSTIYLGIFFSSLFFSCIPKAVLEKQKLCEDERTALKKQNQDFQVSKTELEAQVLDMQKKIKALQQDTLLSGNTMRAITRNYEKLNQTYDMLLSKNRDLLSGNAAENKKLVGDLQNTQEELQKRQDQLKNLELDLEAKKSNLEKLSRELENSMKDLETSKVALAKDEQRFTELQNILKQKDQVVLDLKKKVQDALLGFENKGLTITQKNGKIYVSLDESLLFASGSIKVEDKGIEALKKLAKVLELNADINVLVEGHTDDVPMSGKGEIKDNWDLSVMRATSIVKIITQNSKTDPKRLSAAGRSSYFPLDIAKTADARKKNRRTEIILTPKLDELLKVLESN